MEFALEMLDCPHHRAFAVEKPLLDQTRLWRIKRRIWRKKFPELASTLARSASTSSLPMDSKQSPPKTSSSGGNNKDSSVSVGKDNAENGESVGMTVEALEQKIEELKKKKREYFNLFKQLINTTATSSEKQQKSSSAAGTPVKKAPVVNEPLASPQPAARTNVARPSLPQMSSVSSVASISTVATANDIGRTDSPPSHRTTPRNVSPVTVHAPSRNTSPQMISSTANNITVHASSSSGVASSGPYNSYARSSFSYSRNPLPPPSSSGPVERDQLYDKPVASYPPPPPLSNQDLGRNYSRPDRPAVRPPGGYAPPARKDDLHFGDKPSYPQYPRSQPIDRYSGPPSAPPTGPPPGDRYKDAPLPPSRIPHPSQSTSRYNNYDRPPYDDSQRFPEERGRPLPPPSERYRGPPQHTSRFQPYGNNEDRYRPPPPADRYGNNGGGRFGGNNNSNNTGGPQQSIPPPPGSRPYRPYRPPPVPGNPQQVRPFRPDYVRNYTRPGRQPPPQPQ